MYGIPNMKLEKWVIDRRVKILQDEGIEFVFNADVGNAVSAEELKARYDAVVLCCGAKQARDIQAPGRDEMCIRDSRWATAQLPSNRIWRRRLSVS